MSAYVEDAPDPDTGNAIAAVSAPPEAPEPPSALRPESNVNVFDFLVPNDTPQAPKHAQIPPATSAGGPPSTTPSLDLVGKSKSKDMIDSDYDRRGYSYISEIAPPATDHKPHRTPKVEYITPGTKDLRRQLEKSYAGAGASTDKKRKRHTVSDLDLSRARAGSHDSDHIMEDASVIPPPPRSSLHTGLTGGLTRMLTRSYSPSPERNLEPPSPTKRSKPSRSESVATKSSRHSRAIDSGAGPLVRVSQHRRTSDDSSARPHKKKRKHRTHGTEGGSPSSSHRSKHRKHRTKAIMGPEDAENTDRAVTVFKTRAEFFLSLVTKGEGSERGMSMHKVLKRYHRERAGTDREEEEEGIWRGLRVKRNIDGECVMFWDG